MRGGINLANNIIYGLGSKLQKLREEHNYTQQEIADRVKVHRKSISQYENDNLTPKLETLIQFAIIYNTSLDYLVGIGKESYLYLHEFTDDQRQVILQHIDAIKKNFDYGDKKTSEWSSIKTASSACFFIYGFLLHFSKSEGLILCLVIIYC